MALSSSENSWVESFLDAAEDANLGDWDTRFVADQRKRWGEYGADIRLSPKQWQQLFRISVSIGHELPEGHNYEGDS